MEKLKEMTFPLTAAGEPPLLHPTSHNPFTLSSCLKENHTLEGKHYEWVSTCTLAPDIWPCTFPACMSGSAAKMVRSWRAGVLVSGSSLHLQSLLKERVLKCPLLTIKWTALCFSFLRWLKGLLFGLCSHAFFTKNKVRSSGVGTGVCKTSN